MPLICYVHKSFRPTSQATILKANEIIEEYAEQGFNLTVRQLYYQFVARDLIPNTQQSYKNLCSIVSDARLAGLIDWNAIVDRTRVLKSVPHWDNPEGIINACSEQYRLSLWDDQPVTPEVWIEKDALVGVIEGVCRRYDVPYLACRGYVSQSEMWGAAQRLGEKPSPIIIHLGDHDPSGIDMTRDIRDRLNMFTEVDIEVERIALNMEQVKKYDPPPNPAKLSDTRVRNYITEYGEDSWELDALDPKVIEELIENKILDIMDGKKMKAVIKKQEKQRKELIVAAENWDKVSAQCALELKLRREKKRKKCSKKK